MFFIGNFFLVYFEGCVVKFVLEKVCQMVVLVFGVDGVEVVFIFSVMEVVFLVLQGWDILGCDVEYDVVCVWVVDVYFYKVDSIGVVMVIDFRLLILQFVNFEMGVIQLLLQGLFVMDVM